MKLQFLNNIPLDVISGGNIYNKIVIEGLKQKGVEVDYNTSPIDKNYDISIVDSLSINKINPKNINYKKQILAIIHQFPKLQNSTLNFYRTHAKFIVTGEPIKEELINEWNLNRNNITVIRPGIPKYWMSKINPKKGLKNIVINANFIRRKRYELLIPILKGLNRPELSINIIGNNNIEPDYFEFISNKLKNENINNKINFHFNITQNEVYKILLNSELLLSLSLHETFGMAIFEALCVGLPCIAFETGDIAFFKEYPNYFGVKNSNIKEFISTLKQFYEDKWIKTNLIEKKIPKKRIWEDVINEFETVLKN